nr:transposase [Candidatus Enterovibrio escacola]
MMMINVDDRSLLREWLTNFGSVYIEIKVRSMVHWSGNLQTKEVTLITGMKKNMKPKVMKL